MVFQFLVMAIHSGRWEMLHCITVNIHQFWFYALVCEFKTVKLYLVSCMITVISRIWWGYHKKSYWKEILKSLVGVNLVLRCRNWGYRGQKSHTLSIPLNCFTHFGARPVNETLYKFPRLPTHGALCLFISLLCSSVCVSHKSLHYTMSHYAKTHTVYGCNVAWDINVIDLWYALLVTDGCNCY